MRSPGLRHPARLAGASLLRLQSDERLAELASAGHESAFDAIVDRYRTPLTRYCAGIVGPSRAEDAVQQALINAHDALQRTDEVRNLRSWLYRIAHNAALNVLRAVRDDVPLDEQTLHGGARGGGRGARAGAVGGVGAGAPLAASPAESFERSEEFRSTLAALQALPDRQRAALVLRELEGRSHEEIAAALGVTKGSARQHLMRARVAVRSAVTALTPYPLIVRLAEWAGAGGATAPGWVDGAATAGAGASLAKLTAGLAATGALVGGAVGTEHVVRGHTPDATALPRAAERSAEHVVKRAGQAVVIPAAAVTPAAAAAPAPASAAPHRSDAADRRRSHPGPSSRDDRRSAPRDDAGGTATPLAPSSPSAPSTSHRGRYDASDHGRGREHDSDHGSDTSHRDHHGSSGRHGNDGKADKKTDKHSGKKDDKSNSNGKSDSSAKPTPSTSTPSTSGKSDKDSTTDDPSTSGSDSSGSRSSGSSGSNEPSDSTSTTTSGSSDTTSGKTTTVATPSTTTPSTTADEG